MRKALWIVAFVIAASLTPSALRADDITYDVNANIGGDILAGTITTDGKLGQLSSDDIIAYSLSDSQDLLGATLTTSNSNTNIKTNLDINATPMQLIGEPTGFHLVISYAPNSSSISFFNGSLVQIENLSDVRTAIINPIGVVPEITPASAPSALALVAGVVLIIRGRRKSAASEARGEVC